MEFHKSVLLQESVSGLAIKPGGLYVDVTFGGGGHAREILRQLDENGKLYAFDQDEEAIKNKSEDDRLIMINQNFKYMRNFLRLYKAVPVDGILADLGVSSHQFDVAERGFSTRFEGDLDMRMDKRKKLTAADLINSGDEEKLTSLFRTYGELPNAAKIARTIVTAVKEQPIKTTARLKEVTEHLASRGKENKFFAQVFQALRIEVNEEMDALRELLIQGKDLLKPGGRFVVISYHSLEDKLVKNYFRSGNFEGEISKDFYGNPLVPFRLVTRKAIVPGEEETAGNNRARSAKLRIAEKI
ncbi:MAG: 16S rRNA (cytosine(1402)-N(4))-methyltransferase RsmH [Syntrophothermus sp.]